MFFFFFFSCAWWGGHLSHAHSLITYFGTFPSTLFILTLLFSFTFFRYFSFSQSFPFMVSFLWFYIYFFYLYNHPQPIPPPHFNRGLHLFLIFVTFLVIFFFSLPLQQNHQIIFQFLSCFVFVCFCTSLPFYLDFFYSSRPFSSSTHGTKPSSRLFRSWTSFVFHYLLSSSRRWPVRKKMSTVPHLHRE